MTEEQIKGIVKLIGGLWPRAGYTDEIMGELVRRIEKLNIDIDKAEASLRELCMTATGFTATSPEPAVVFERIARHTIALKREPRWESHTLPDDPRTLVAARFWNPRHPQGGEVQIMTWPEYAKRAGIKTKPLAAEIGAIVGNLDTDRAGRGKA